MSGLFNLDAPIWVFMSEVADIIILSLLWWLGCLGIVTIGASTTAVYYVIGKKVRKETTYIARDFFKSFRQNLKQSVPLSFFTIIGTISFFLYITLVIQAILVPSNATSLKILIPLTLFAGFEFFNFNAYLWGLLSRFDTKSIPLIKASFTMMHRYLLISFANLIIIVGVCYFIYRVPLGLVVAPGLIIGAQSFLLQHVFNQYIETQGKHITA